MNTKEEINKIYKENFAELGLPKETADSEYANVGGRRVKLWKYMTEAEKDEQRFRFYREELSRWQSYIGKEYIEDEDFKRSHYAFEDDDDKGKVFWRFNLSGEYVGEDGKIKERKVYSESDVINTKFKFFKLRYIVERNYVDWVHFKLENEIAILEERRNTELKKKWYKRVDGKKGAYVERRFWKPCKEDMRYCEIFFTYGRNKRFDLIDNNRLVLKVQNKKSVVLKTLRLLHKHYFDTVAYDIEQLYVDKLKNDYKGKVKKKFDLYQTLYCIKDEKIESYIDVIKYEKRSKMLRKIYNQSYWSMIWYAKYRGENVLEQFEWDNDSNEWKCNKVFKHLIKDKNEREIRKYNKWDTYRNDDLSNKKEIKVDLSEDDLDDLFKDI